MQGTADQQQAGENAVRRKNNSLPLPKAFDGHPANWKKWCQRFDRHHLASGPPSKTEKEQVSIYVYAMGDCAADILAILSVDEETVSFAYIKRERNVYFGDRTNVVVEREGLNKQQQQQQKRRDSQKQLTLSFKICTR